MLSSVLNSERVITVHIAIMRTFVRLRHIIATHKELAGKLEAMEYKYDKQFQLVLQILRQLTELEHRREKNGWASLHSPKQNGVSPSAVLRAIFSRGSARLHPARIGEPYWLHTASPAFRIDELREITPEILLPSSLIPK